LPKLKGIAQDGSTSSAAALKAILALNPDNDTNRALCDLTLAAAPAEATAAGHAARARGGCPLEPFAEKLKNFPPHAALHGIASLGPPAARLGEKLLPFLSSSDANNRKLAADALFEIGDSVHAAAVLKALDAETKAVAPLVADWVPAELPAEFSSGYDPNAAPTQNDAMRVVRMRQSDVIRRALDLREQRAKATGHTASRASAPVELIDDANEEQMRVVAALLRAAGRLKVDGVNERLALLIKSPLPSIRAAAFAALAWLDQPERAKAGLYDAEPKVRIETASALLQHKPKGVEAVVSAATELGFERAEVLQALLTQRLERANAEKLLPLLAEGGAEVALIAPVMVESKVTEAISVFERLLGDPTQIGRKEVLLGLAKLSQTATRDQAEKELYSDSPQMRVAAAKAHAVFAKGQSSEALDALRGDYYLEVREAVSSALKP
jgi:hypothetical protein